MEEYIITLPDGKRVIIEASSLEEAKRIHRKEREAFEKECEEVIEILQTELDELNESIKKREAERAYYQDPTWYLFENTATGELISIALTDNEKSKFLELIPTLKKRAWGGK